MGVFPYQIQVAAGEEGGALEPDFLRRLDELEAFVASQPWIRKTLSVTDILKEMNQAMHSGDPAEAIVRLLEMGIAPYQVVGALTAVCAQRLVRTVCAACRGEGECDTCAGTGYAGRTACGQIAVMDEPLRQAILRRTPAGDLRRMIDEQRPGLAADARRLVDGGRTLWRQR